MVQLQLIWRESNIYDWKPSSRLMCSRRAVRSSGRDLSAHTAVWLGCWRLSIKINFGQLCLLATMPCNQHNFMLCRMLELSTCGLSNGLEEGAGAVMKKGTKCLLEALLQLCRVVETWPNLLICQEFVQWSMAGSQRIIGPFAYVYTVYSRNPAWL